LNNQLFNLRTREEELRAKIEKLTNDIEDAKTEIARLQLKKTEGIYAKINDIKGEIGKLELEKTEGIEAKINDFKTELNALKLKRRIISNIKIIQEAEISTYPVKPKKKLYVLVSAVIGLVLFTVLTFFVEYIRNANRERRDSVNNRGNLQSS